MTATGSTRRSVARTSVMMLTAVLALVLSLVLVVVLGLRALGLPVLFDRVTDHGHRVSIEIPPGWTFEAPADGGQISTDNGSSGEGEPYRVPDIHAQSWLSGSGATYVDLDVGPAAAGDDESQDQTRWVDETCRTFADCTVLEPAQPLEVAGEPAREQVLSVNGATLYLATLRHGGYLVRYQGFSDTALDGGQELRRIWSTLHVYR